MLQLIVTMVLAVLMWWYLYKHGSWQGRSIVWLLLALNGWYYAAFDDTMPLWARIFNYVIGFSCFRFALKEIPTKHTIKEAIKKAHE